MKIKLLGINLTDDDNKTTGINPTSDDDNKTAGINLTDDDNKFAIHLSNYSYKNFLVLVSHS